DVERFVTISDVITPAGECVESLHPASLLKGQQPIETGKIRRRKPRDAPAGKETGFEFGHHRRTRIHSHQSYRHQADCTTAEAKIRSFVSRPTVGRCDQTS